MKLLRERWRFSLPHRLIQLIGVAAGHLVHAAAARQATGTGPWGWLARRTARRGDLDEPARLCAFIQDLGGAFLKLGQMLAMQPDLLPPAYSRALLDLLDRVPAEDFAAIERVVLKELGAPPHELFDAFDTRPFASASIGQVHRARLDGCELAVKIQRPGAERDFRGDLRILRSVAWTIRRLGRRRWRWVADHLDEMVRWTRQELDYRYEAGYGQVLARQAGPGQRVPRILDRYSSQRVLCMEWLDGSTVAEYWRRSPQPQGPEVFDRAGFARQVIDNFLEQVFVHGLFHADLHPANLMVLSGGPDLHHRTGTSAVGYLDFGIIGELGPFARQRLVAMTLAYARGDLRAMANAMLDLSEADDQASFAVHRARFLEIGEGWYERRSGLPRLRRSFTAVLLDMLTLSRQTGVWPERPVLKYVRSLMAIDALVARLAPTLDAGAYLEGACRRLLMQRRPLPRRLSFSARRLRKAGHQASAVIDRLAHGQLLSIELYPRGETPCHR